MAHDHVHDMATTMMPTDMMMTNCTMDMMMQMYFSFGSFQLLFDSWMVDRNNGGVIFGSMLAMFVLTVVLEGLKAFREWLQGWTLNKYSNSSAGGKDEELKDTDQQGKMFVTVKNRDKTMPILFHIIQAILYTIQVGITYLLMLAVMTFNGAIFLSICVGAGVGYLLFGWIAIYKAENSRREQSGYCH